MKVKIFIFFSSLVEEQVKVLELYTTLELLLESTKTLEVVVLSNEGKEIKLKGCSSRECCQQLIDDIAHQTALYCSKMLQVSELTIR